MAICVLLPLQVCVYAPPAGFKGQWPVAADLSAKLLEYCEASNWRVRSVTGHSCQWHVHQAGHLSLGR